MRLFTPIFFLAFLCQIPATSGQTDSLPGVLTIFPESGSGAYAPAFSPFCHDVCWLDERAFNIPENRFLSRDSTLSCLPANARRMRYGTDPKYPFYLRWKTDPFNNSFYWTYEYRNDTLVIWRYNLETARQDSFISLYRGTEMAFGKPGIWVSNHQELVLLDRHTGAEMARAGKAQEGMLMYLRPWGEDVIIGDRWLYQRDQKRYVPFFPLPGEMEGCKSPGETVFYEETCISWTVGDNNEPTEFVNAPGQIPIQLPFKRDWRIKRYDLGANFPYVWFSFPDKIVAFNYTTGDSLVYAGDTGEPLIGNQNGRFLGFRSESGHSFFDKNTCQFRALDRPYGFEWPRNFTCDERYIYLTYEHNWEIIDFSTLNNSFKRSPVLDEFEVFNREQEALQKSLPEDFYPQYEAYAKLFNQYKDSKNPKIEAFWDQIGRRLEYCLYTATDTVLERVSSDYMAGYFPSNLTCKIAQSLFQYRMQKNDLLAASQLLGIGDNYDCIEYNMNNGSYYVYMLNNTLHQLDSINNTTVPPDERLYATGKVWWDYCFSHRAMAIWNIPHSILEKPTAIFKSLIEQHPNSPWADNAAYDTLFFIDYYPKTTDDETPPGNDNAAYKAFTRFLKDYPHSDRRPDVLLRLAKVVQRGVYDEQYRNINKEMAAECLNTIAKEYPEFAKNSEDYIKFVAYLNQQMWANRWSIFVFFDREKYRLQDTIRVTVHLHNQSTAVQTLDSNFLEHWHTGIKLSLSAVRDQGCEGLWGDFPVSRMLMPGGQKAVAVQPGAYYAETFILGRRSLNKNYGGGAFELTSGSTYQYHLEFRHDLLSWLWVSAQKGGKFRVE